MEKVYLYKIYNSSGTFITTWTDVVSPLNVKYEINGGLPPLTIRLARLETNYGELEDVKQGNLLKIYVFDKESGVNGICIYSGILVNYVPTVSGGEEYVDVVFYSHYWDLNNKIVEDSGDTEVPYLSYDPSDILKDLMDKYHAITGTTLNYSATSIEDTGTTVSYTYNTDTYQSAIKKVIELCPDGWYYRVEPDDYIYLKEKEATPTHKFTIGKDIMSYKPEKKFDNIINTVYFRGGDTGGGVMLYNKYTNSSSVSDYGTRATIIVDQRVTTTATAQIMANRILDKNASPETRVILKVLDSNTAEIVKADDQTQLNTDGIKNADFENAPPFTAATTTANRWVDGTTGTTTYIGTHSNYGWWFYDAGGSAQYDSSEKHSGNYSMKLSTLAAASYCIIVNRLGSQNDICGWQKSVIKCKPLTSYRLTYWMKTNYVSGDSSYGAYVNAAQYKLDGTGVSSAGTYIKTTTDWTQYTKAFTTAVNAAYISLECRIYGHSGSTADLIMDAWFDDIVLEELVDGEYVSVPDACIIGGSSGVQKIAQQFIPTEADFQGLYVKKYYDYGTYTGDITVSIKNDSSDLPIGSTVATIVIPNATWIAYASGEEIFIPLPCTLTPSSKYWVTFASSTEDDNNFTSIISDNNFSYGSGLSAFNGYNGANSALDLQTTYWRASQFAAQKSSFDELKFKAYKTGSPTGNLTISIETDSANKPSGSVLATVDVDVSTFTTVLAQYTVNLPCSLDIGTKYHIVFKGQSTWDATNRALLYYGFGDTPTVYNGGAGSWTATDAYTWIGMDFDYWIPQYKDLYFRTVYNSNLLGYDLESIKVGETCQICNATLQSYNLWDESFWDIDAWDFDTTNAAGQQLQIMSIDYYPDYAILELSNKQPDISKRIEDIDRNWKDNITVDNPTTPS